ncbi:MAG TPA: cobalamin-binding protein [Actinomycetota bacterium]|nr:cobalamin-binding protein [Actinomycetota bacterium]
MRIVSLLPSATEIVCALGLGDDLVGVTDECDHPPEVTTKPVVVRTALPHGLPRSAGEIDRAVRDRMDRKEPLYVLERELIRELRPDVILTQDLCRVCAVPTGQVERALEELGATDARVLSLDPATLEDVLETIRAVGKLLGREERAEELVGSLRERVAWVRVTAQRLPAISVFCLEWSDPPFAAGHWVPEMVEAVGGVPLLSEKGASSRVVGWHQVAQAGPEVIVCMPCGYYLDEAEEEAATLLRLPDFADTPAAREGNVFAVDATSYFSRPGPRLVEGLELLAWAVHPEAFPEPPPGRIARVGPR